MIIKFYMKKRDYGRKRLYIVDNKQKMWLMKLTKKTTISEGDKQALEELGYTFKQVAEPKTK